MGCQPSKCATDVELKRGNTIVAKPKASITVGQGIGHHHGTETRVVFIFGNILAELFKVLLCYSKVPERQTRLG